MTPRNLADCLDQIVEIRGDGDALIQGDRRISWKELGRRARNLAAWFVSRGASRQAKVAVYTYNHSAYMEGCYAAMKAALVPVNVNYRYREGELRYLLDNADAEFAIVHEDFAPLLEKVRRQLPKLRAVLTIAEPGGAPGGIEGAEPYEAVAETDRPAPVVTRSGDDLFLLYTGGTTGMPKGVMWRQSDLYERLGGGGFAPSPEGAEAFRAFVEQPPMRFRTLVAPPLMHGTGWFTAMIAWLTGGAVILLDHARKFDPAELWTSVQRDRVNAVSIVGDSFAKPMLRELRAGGRDYDPSSLRLIVSSGVMWSQEVKRGLLEHNPEMALIDAFSSSEALGLGLSITTTGGETRTGRFELSDTNRLFDEQLRPIETAPGARGLVGAGGPQPIGYYKDPERSARTFVEVAGDRYVVPGDWAEVNEDGVSLTLLGRGSVCINTGGEKVFPEEVEEAIKRHPGVTDAVVVGVPDEEWGEAVTAVVSAAAAELDPDAIKSLVRERLAGHKVPKHVVMVEEVYRSPAGKADFARTRRVALEALGIAV